MSCHFLKDAKDQKIQKSSREGKSHGYVQHVGNHIGGSRQYYLNGKQHGGYKQKENLMGSVIPVSIQVRAADRRSPPAAFFFSDLAWRYMASAAPGSPKIMKMNSPEKYLVASALKCTTSGKLTGQRKYSGRPG